MVILDNYNRVEYRLNIRIKLVDISMNIIKRVELLGIIDDYLFENLSPHYGIWLAYS